MICRNCGKPCASSVRPGYDERCCPGTTPCQVGPGVYFCKYFLVDSANCGDCGVQCGSDEWCVGGSCVHDDRCDGVTCRSATVCGTSMPCGTCQPSHDCTSCCTGP